MGGQTTQATARSTSSDQSRDSVTHSSSPSSESSQSDQSASASIPRYTESVASSAPLASYSAVTESSRGEYESVRARTGFGESISNESSSVESSTASVSETEVQSTADESNESDETSDESAAEETEQTEGENAEEAGVDEEQEETEEGEQEEEAQEEEETDEESEEEEEESSGSALMSSESGGLGGAGDDAEPVTALVAAIPRMTRIQSPYVASPPKQAIEKRDEIIKRTGSPPELHHAKVRQAAQQVTQAARDAQRRMIIRVGLIAKDSRISIEDMAAEISVATRQAIGYINGAIDTAILDIENAAVEEMQHIDEHGVQVGEDAQVVRDNMMVSIFNDLQEGSTKIQEANDIAQTKYDEKIPQAENLIFQIPENGQVDRLPVEGGSSNPSDADYQVISEAQSHLQGFIDSESSNLADGKAQTYAYMKGRAEPFLLGYADSHQTSLVQNAQQNAERLSNEANRAQFMIMVLGLTGPVSKYHESDESESVDTEEEAGSSEMSAADQAAMNANNTIYEKSNLATEYCHRDLRENLTKNIRKSGRKAEQAMMRQAKQAEIGLNSSTVMMAEDYRDLIARLETLLEPGRFLDARTMVPKVMQARDSAARLLLTHEEVAEQQASNTEAMLDEVKKDQIENLFKSAHQSADSVRDVVTRSVFDMSLFSSMMTGHMSEGASSGMDAARVYAEGMTAGILSSNEAVHSKAMEQIETTAASFCNGQISGAEQSQFNSLNSFVERMEETGSEGTLTKPMIDAEVMLRDRANKLNHAMPERDYVALAGGAAATALIPGAQLYGAVAMGVYLYETTPDDDQVVVLLGDLIHPGAPAVGEIFEQDLGFGNLQSRIEEKIDDPEKSAALSKFAGTARERGLGAVEGMANSTGWFDLSREAREAMGKGMSAEEYSAVSFFHPDVLKDARATITEDLDEHEREIGLAYLENNRERAVAARSMEALDKGRDEGMWGWIFSAEEAQDRSDVARVDAIAGIQRDLRDELTIESSYVSPAMLSEATGDVYREVASIRDTRGRGREAFTVEQGRESIIGYATRSHAAAVLDVSFNPINLAMPISLTADIEHIEMSENAEQYIRDAVNFGEDSDQAKASRGIFELERVEDSSVFGQFGEAISELPGLGGIDDHPAFGELTNTDQIRLSDAFENTRLSDLERLMNETTDPDRRARYREQYEEELTGHRARMSMMARRLGAPESVVNDPVASQNFMATRLGNVFSRADSAFTTPEGYTHGSYGVEMIMHGRASLETGAALASEGWGTNDALLRRSYTNRTEAEREAARGRWRELYNEDMDVAMGIKDREWDESDYLMFGMSPALWFAQRGSETSGDLALELQGLADNDGKTDMDSLRGAALRHRSERGKGTGIIADQSMEGTDSQVNLDGSMDRLASLVLEEAARRDPEAAAEFAGNPGGIYRPDGSIDPRIAAAAFEDGAFRGDRSRFAMYSGHVRVDADAYRAELDRQEAMITTTIAVLAMIATVAAMLIPGVNAVVAGIAIAIISGTATMLVKAGMRGERYGWEEAATDAAMMAVEAASAGVGGAMGGGLGAQNVLARFGSALTTRLGKVGGAMAREAITAAISSGAQVALQDETWNDGFMKGLENMATGAVRSAAVAAVTAGISEGVASKLNSALIPGELTGSNLTGLKGFGQRLGPHGTSAISEAVSEFFGTAAGESVGLAIDHSRGKFTGKFGDALKMIGEAALRDAATGAIRGAVNSVNRARYQNLLEAARSQGDISPEQLRALHLFGISAGTLHYGDGPEKIRHEVFGGQERLARLPKGIREQAQRMDTDSLDNLLRVIETGDFGEGKTRQSFIQDLQESHPGLVGSDFMKALDTAISGRRGAKELPGVGAEQAQQIRSRLAADLEPGLRDILAHSRIDGLEHLSDADLKVAAEMVARGRLDMETADRLFASAKQKNPELDETTFLSNLHGAVKASEQAQRLEQERKRQVFEEVMSNLDEEGRNVFAGMDSDKIAALKSMMEAQDLGTPHEQKMLFEVARQNNPDLSETEFKRLLETGIANAAQKQQQLREAARAQREKHLLNIPDEQRGIISALPDDALIELRVRQQQGETLSPADKQRFIDAALKESPDVDVRALQQALDISVAHRSASNTPENQGKLREQLLAGIPQDQRAQFGDVPILVMRDSEFEAFTRSKSGQAVTLMVHGRPVVVMRESADPMSLREEGIHVLQSKDPEWAERIGALDERHLADWDKLPLSEQLSLYKNKLAIEIDAQHRMISGLETDLSRVKDPAERARLQARLEMTEAALGNLMNRAREVGSIDTMDMLAINAGRMKKPDWLDQPARLFQKQKDTDTEIRTETERIPEEDHEAIITRLARGLDETDAAALRQLAEKLPIEDLRVLSDPDIDQAQVRGVLANLAKTADFESNAARLARVMLDMSAEQRQFVAAHMATTTTKHLVKYIDGMTRLRDNVESSWEFEKLLGSTLRTDKKQFGRIELKVLDRLVEISSTVGKDSMRDMLSFINDGNQIRKMLELAGDQDDSKAFVDTLVRVLNHIDPGQKRTEALEWFAMRSTQEALSVIRGLDQIRDHFYLESTYRAMVDVVMTSPSRKIDVITHLVDMSLRLDVQGRKAFAELIDKVSKSDRAEIIKSLIEIHEQDLAPIQSKLDKDHKGRLLNVVMEMAAIVATNGSQWRVFISQTLDVLKTLADLPKSAENDAAVKQILDYLYETKTDTSLTPAERRERLTQLAADLKASSKQLREPDPDNPGKTRLFSIEQRENIIGRQAKNLEGDGPDRYLAGKDAWAERLATAKDTYDSDRSDPKTEPFARLLESVRSDWDEKQWGVMLKVQPWFEKMAELHGLDPKSTDPAEVKKLEQLLKRMIDQGLSKTDTDNVLSESRFKQIERAFRDMTVAADLANDPTHAAAVQLARKKVLKRMNLTEADLQGRNDGGNLNKHIEALIKQQLTYERMLSIAGEIDVDIAGVKQNITEVHGELALTVHMIRNHPDMLLAMPFGKGTGFDQVWIRTSNGKLDGPIVEVVIGEAKGHGASLGNPIKGKQMGVKWVAETLREMAASSRADVRLLAKRLIEATAALKGGTPPAFRGIVVEAKPKSGAPQEFEPHDITEGDRGGDGYDFTGIDLPKPNEIQII